MKTLILLCSMLLIGVFPSFGQFQKSVQVQGKHHHDLNAEPIPGTSDFIVSGNLFDPTMQQQELFVKRVNNLGNVIWYRTYSDGSGTFTHARAFDIVVRGTEIYLVGSVDTNGQKYTMVLEFDVAAGGLSAARYYNPVISSFHSRGLKIITTNSDADGDGVPDPGFVVGGFFSDCYNVDVSCNGHNIGFVMRLDLGLNPLWTEEIDTIPNSGDDYDFVNGLVETSDGFFITGSATDPSSSPSQQAVLAYKLNLDGSFAWNASYVFGNSQDVSVDAFYDIGSNTIFMLANYSFTHYFGVTAITNNGVIVPGQSWYTMIGGLNRYGFKIMESYSNGNHLVVTGYDRNENWVDGNNNSLYGESTIFVHEFQKSNGNPVGTTYQYLVPNVEPPGDEFNFWSAQMPLIYYPDISFLLDFPGNNGVYHHVGYRRNPSAGNFVESELISTPQNRINECDFQTFTLPPTLLTQTTVTPLSGSIPNMMTPFNLTPASVSYTQEMCTRTLSVSDYELEELKLYPNPASQQVIVSGTRGARYSIFDFSGKRVLEGKLSNNRTLDVSMLSAGMYFVQIEKNSANVAVLKLMKR